MLHMNKTISPPKPSRVSVPVSAEVLQVFQRLAKASNMSVGRAMAEWLGDTLEGANYMGAMMEKARIAPKVVASEMHAYALALSEDTSAIMEKMKAMGKAPAADRGRRPRSDDGAAAGNPPSCNTGGKVSKTQTSPSWGNPGFPLPPAKVQAYANTNGMPRKAPK